MSLALCTVLAASAFAVDETPTPAQLLTKMRKAYAAVDAVYLETEISHPFYTLGVPLKIGMKKPRSVRIDVDMKGGQKLRVVSDGKSMVLSDLTKPVAKVPMTETNQFGRLPANLEAICFVEAERELSTRKGGNMAGSKLSVQAKQNIYILKETVSNPDRKIFYEIDRKTLFIMKTTEFRDSEAKPYATYKVVKLDTKPKFAAGYFDFPKTVEER